MTPVYDVSGVVFTRGVTDFTTENVLCALRSVGIIERMRLFALVPVIIYDKLLQSNLLEYCSDGTIRWGRLEITIDPNDKCADKVFARTFLSDGRTEVMLITREY